MEVAVKITKQIERFAPGGHPTTLPNPGVYARHNAVDTPALLPDGTTSELSVNRTLDARHQVSDPDRFSHHRDTDVVPGTARTEATDDLAAVDPELVGGPNTDTLGSEETK